MKQKKYKQFFRYFLLAFIFLAIIFIGFVRDQYVVNLADPDLPLLINRKSNSIPVNPLEESAITPDLRWYTLPLYIIAYAALSAVFLYLLFHRKEGMLWVAGSYALLIMITCLLLLVYLLSDKKPIFYTLAQQIKEFMLSPFLLLFLTAVYYAALRRG